MNKSSNGPAIYRSIGSIAFAAAARAVWAVTRDKDNSRRRLVLPAKNNLAPDSLGLAYSLEPYGANGTAVVCWEPDPVTTSADEAMQGDTSKADAEDGNGRKRILFIDGSGDRKAVRLGKISVRTAEKIKIMVEALNAAEITNCSPDRETTAWVADLGDDLHAKLAAVGLTTPRRMARLGEFLDAFIDNRRPSAAPNTITNLEQAKRRLIEHFGPDRDMRRITPADADGWAAALAENYAPATAGRTIKRARQFFKLAIRDKIVTENPFVGVKASGAANKERQHHIDADIIARVIDAAPDHEWRLIIALSRFGGLRCPSEHLALRWQDMDWARNRFRVDSPKTGERWVPMFPELRPHLEAAFELAEEGAVYCINRYRDSNANLRTTFTKIIRRAGVKVWPKLFHNLRASRETELAATYPIHVVCEWIGELGGDCGQALFDRAGRGFRAGSPRRRKIRRTRGAESGAATVRDELQDFATLVGSQSRLRRYATATRRVRCYAKLPSTPKGTRTPCPFRLKPIRQKMLRQAPKTPWPIPWPLKRKLTPTWPA